MILQMTDSLYKIKRTNNFSLSLNAVQWDYANKLIINNWPWHMESYATPKVTVKLLYDNKNLFVKFNVSENYTKAMYTKYQDMVCQDSCVEFFVTCDNNEYFNFEVSAVGTLLLYLGEDRNIRIPIPENDASKIQIITSLPKGIKLPTTNFPNYSVAYSIPFTLFAKYSKTPFPASKTCWKGNFYKCGDLTPEPSWGCWSKIITESPDFHRPDFFGNLLFE
jgi:hypothetical protein